MSDRSVPSHIINPNNISIDRIDPNKGYTKENVQLICNRINRLKYTLSENDFFEICDLVIKHVPLEDSGLISNIKPPAKFD